jgi:hypothetical protein
MKSPTMCGNYRRYKGLKAPKCGCDMCQMKFTTEELRRTVSSLQDMVYKHDRFCPIDPVTGY